MGVMAAAENDVAIDALGQAEAYRDGLLVALLAATLLRRKNLVGIEIGRHLVPVGHGWHLVFTGSEMKARRPFEVPWPAPLEPPLLRYLELYRPRLLGARSLRAALGQPQRHAARLHHRLLPHRGAHRTAVRGTDPTALVSRLCCHLDRHRGPAACRDRGAPSRAQRPSYRREILQSGQGAGGRAPASAEPAGSASAARRHLDLGMNLGSNRSTPKGDLGPLLNSF